MSIFKLPDLGEGLPDAEIHEWFVKEGDTVELDQPLVSMETAKAIVDVPAPQTGKIIKLYGQAGDIIATGSPLIEFEAEGEGEGEGEGEVVQAETPTQKKDNNKAAEKSKATEDQGTVVGAIASTGETVADNFIIGAASSAAKTSIQATPKVRALAKKLNVDLTTVQTQSPNGIISLEEVQAAAQHTPTQKTELTEATSLRGVRRAMALSMTQSHQEVVPVSLFDDADIHSWPDDIDITVKVIQSIVTACKQEPALNAWFDGKALAVQKHEHINLGLAVDTEEGLFVPVIQKVDTLTQDELRKEINSCKQGVKARDLPANKFKGATITLSNFGTFAGRYASPIIVPPTVAIIATGKIRETIVPVNGKSVVHPVLPLSLSFDHRACTGGEASRFLGEMIKALKSA